ncbi:ferredoxin [Pseudonocardia oroxyli]|uniref:Ferredoxin n=1 Tax=Pseudonocardia oroxyli TaxID=366584 RepID=A0A1G8D002_PSEOR|nr:ferredoxin [Pseudonocardia oroxyli]SDH50520.1 4Fe-4S binding domain-containing protein [Pseudonocardia oroxyli]
MPYVIAAACVDIMDRSCMDECPVDCIYEGSRKLYINPLECIDCGACEPACPVEAISQDRAVPAGQEEFVADGLRFFEDVLPGRDAPLGLPGGANDLGPVGIDTDFIASYRKEG